MPTGVYERTEACNKAHKVKMSEHGKTNIKIARSTMDAKTRFVSLMNMPETKEKRNASLKIANEKRDVKERKSKAQKEAQNRPDVKEKHRQSAIKQLLARKGPFRDTPPEKQLHAILRNVYSEDEIISQFYVKNIVVVDKFVPKDNLILEADGYRWHNLPGRQERDKIRTEKMRALGYKVLRFWDYELASNPQECLNKINEICRRDL